MLKYLHCHALGSSTSYRLMELIYPPLLSIVVGGADHPPTFCSLKHRNLWDGLKSKWSVCLQYNRSFAEGSRFVSISAGSDHLLALTSSGRAFAHPITQNANAFGQLAIRNIEQRLPSGELAAVDLKPKPLPDLLGNVGINLIPAPSASLAPAKVEKAFNCPFIYEIPSLVGIRMRQLVAGGRSSFAVTDSGRVLGWGANEFGCETIAIYLRAYVIHIAKQTNWTGREHRGDRNHCPDGD
jgi:alpha-tubulin suppressor-like RCC1 family protein